MTIQDWKDFLYESDDDTKLGGVEVRHIAKESSTDELLIWIPPSWLDYFTDLLGDHLFDDGGIEAHITNGGYVCVDISPLLELDGITIKDVLRAGDYRGEDQPNA